MARPPIRILDLDITEKCPLACDYCYKHKKARTMDRSLAFRAIDWLFQRSGDREKLSVNFVGGEPMAVFPFMKEVAAHGRKRADEHKKKISFGGPTSSSVMTDEIIDFLRQQRYPLVLSIDGAPETHDAHRILRNGRGSSEIVFKNIPKVLKVFPRALGRMTVTPESAGLMSENVKYLFGMGFQRVTPTPVHELDWSQSQLDDLTREMRILSDLYIEELRAGKEIRIKFLDSTIKRIIQRKRPKYPCQAGRGMVGVDIDGNVFPCHRFLGLGKGHPLCMGTLDDYDDSARDPYLKLNNRREECADCVAAVTCGGGCYYVNFQTHGDISTPNANYCRYMQASYVEAARVHEILLGEKNPVFMKKFYSKRKKKGKVIPPAPYMSFSVQASSAWSQHLNIIEPKQKRK